MELYDKWKEGHISLTFILTLHFCLINDFSRKLIWKITLTSNYRKIEAVYFVNEYNEVM